MAKHVIILADDHPAIRESVATFIKDKCRAELEVAAQVSDGLEAIQAVKKHRPDLIVIDIGMPRLNGIEAIREIKRLYDKTIVLVFSMYDDQAHIVEAIRAGADDYLFKREARPEVIVSHILKALGGDLPTQDRLHQSLFSAIRDYKGSPAPSDFSKLTGAELEVLKRVAHRGLSMKEIAADLGGKEGNLSENTVRKHLEHVYEKLGAANQAHAVCLAVKQGIISAEDAEPVL